MLSLSGSVFVFGLYGVRAHAGELSCVCVRGEGVTRLGGVSACSAFLRCCQRSLLRNYPSVEQALS